MFLIGFPLLLVPVVLYNMAVFLLDLDFNAAAFSVLLLSGQNMAISIGDVLVLLGILLLYVEIFKATRLTSKAIMDHVLSFVLFIAMIVEFVAVERAATSTFLFLTALSFVDVIGGLTISIRTAQRDIALEHPEEIAAQG